MSAFVYPGIESLVFSILIGLIIYLNARQEQGRRPRNLPLYPARFRVYTVTFVGSFLIHLIFLPLKSPESWFSSLLTDFSVLSVCLGLLLLLLPLLRRFLRAESCASLWVVFCFVFINSIDTPRWTISIPFSLPSRQVMTGLLWVWLTGCIAVLTWHIVGHIRFRRKLLKNATPLDGNVSAAFHKRLQIANISAGEFSAVCSPAAQAPVSIGLFQHTSRLVLPDRDYTPEELALIFQHEIIHISRKDNILKLIMVLIAATLWFHPLVWVALRSCAADLELSCDEAVIYGRTPEDRKAYASLLLDTKAEAQGFTTCLSASAKSLRYRLKHIVHPKKRIVGAIIVGLLCYGLLFLGMNIGVRFAPAPAKEQIFHGEDLAQIEIPQVVSTVDGVDKDGYGADRAILQYVAGLSLSKTDETPDVYESDDWVQIDLRSPTHGYRLFFGGNYLRVDAYDYSLPDNAAVRHTTDYYYLESQPDWELLNSYIVPK